MKELTLKQRIKIIKDALEEKKGRDIAVLEVAELTVIADCFIIVSASNSPQVKALAENVDTKLSENGIQPLRREGIRDARWVVLDYGDIIVHIFKDETRLMYALEQLWAK